jgi:predicted secreted protein
MRIGSKTETLTLLISLFMGILASGGNAEASPAAADDISVVEYSGDSLNSVIALSPKSVAVIKLPENMPAGYSWFVQDELPRQIKVLGTRHVDEVPGRIGGSGWLYIYIAAAGSGAAQATWNYRRPFEPAIVLTVIRSRHTPFCLRMEAGNGG